LDLIGVAGPAGIGPMQPWSGGPKDRPEGSTELQQKKKRPCRWLRQGLFRLVFGRFGEISRIGL